MTEKAKQARREYARQYREKNREKIKATHTKWRIANADKIKQAQERYWERKANEQNSKEKARL